MRSAIALVSRLLAIGLGWLGPRHPARNRAQTTSTFIADPLADKRIAVRGWSAREIAAILRDFSSLYGDQLHADFRVEVEERPGSVSHLRFPEDVETELFYFLLNALNCPRDFDLQGRSVAVLGSVVLTAACSWPEPTLFGQQAWIYLPSGNCDYDEVYLRLRSGPAYRHSIAAGRWVPEDDARMPQAVEALCGGLASG